MPPALRLLAPALTPLLALAIVVACSDREERGAPSAPPGSGSSVSGGSGVGSSSSSSGGGGGGGGGDSGPAPDAMYLPKPTETCPQFEDGTITLKLDGMPARDAVVRMSSAAESADGPFIVVWHASTQTPSEAIEQLLGDELDEILDLGGVVVAPVADPTAGAGVFPWFTYLGDFNDGVPDPEDDFRVFDELLACAIEQVGIDTRRIHTIGFHEGSVQALHTAILRSGVIASVVAHSTAITGSPAEQETDNAFPAMILYGGSSDVDSNITYATESPKAADRLTNGEAPLSIPHFTILCDHGGGTFIASDAIPATVAFLLDHPFGTDPSPYADKVPSSLPGYCVVNQ